MRLSNKTFLRICICSLNASKQQHADIVFIIFTPSVSTPATASVYIATACRKSTTGQDWYRRSYYKEKGKKDDKYAPCVELDISPKSKPDSAARNDGVVFSVHLPHPPHTFSAIQQFMSVSMNVELDSFKKTDATNPNAMKPEQTLSKFHSLFYILVCSYGFICLLNCPSNLN